MTNQMPAQLAYEAYGKATGGLTHDGRPMPTWDQLGDRIRHAWAAAALATRRAAAAEQRATLLANGYDLACRCDGCTACLVRHAICAIDPDSDYYEDSE